jgi:hypothetical protein
VRPLLATAAVGVCLALASVSCAPSAAPGATALPTADPFAVVRATSEAAYQKGEADRQRGDLQQALVDLDTAKTNDPDSRSDIQQALDQTVRELQAMTPTVSGTTQSRPIVVATVALASPAAATPVAVAGASPSPVVLAPWADPQGRFSIGAPAGWTSVPRPQSLVGTPVVEFLDPTARAELDVAVDSGARAVSPEQYAAGVELAMQQQVHGYAAEQTMPLNLAGTAAFQRLFTFAQQDASGAQHQARGLQIVVLKGSTPYIISATAPAEVFAAAYNPVFQQMVDSFRFS